MICQQPRASLFPYRRSSDLEKYIDNLSRIVAWQTLDKYPLVSIVSLTEKGVYAPYEARRRDYLNMALGASMLLAQKAILDRKSTRLNSSHANISYAVFCLKK